MSIPWEPYGLGWLAGANLEILAVHDGGRLATTWYRVRYGCCGAEADLLHSSVIARLYRDHSAAPPKCRACVQTDSARRARERAQGRAAEALPPAAPPMPGARAGALGLVDRLWRRPPSLAGQPPGVWGAP